MVNNFIEGLGKGLVALVILAMVTVVGYATGTIIGAEDPQVTAIGFTTVCVIIGVVNTIRGNRRRTLAVRPAARWGVR